MSNVHPFGGVFRRTLLLWTKVLFGRHHSSTFWTIAGCWRRYRPSCKRRSATCWMDRHCCEPVASLWRGTGVLVIRANHCLMPILICGRAQSAPVWRGCVGSGAGHVTGTIAITLSVCSPYSHMGGEVEVLSPSLFFHSFDVILTVLRR